MPGLIIFDPEDSSVGMSTADDQAAGVYLDIENDALYLSNLTNIIQWEGSTTPMQGRWKSGQLKMRRPVNFGAAMVDAEDYSDVTFQLYAEFGGAMTLKASVAVTDDEPFRLPGGYTSATYEIEIVSSNRVVSVAVAQNILELAGEE